VYSDVNCVENVYSQTFLTQFLHLHRSYTASINQFECLQNYDILTEGGIDSRQANKHRVGNDCSRFRTGAVHAVSLFASDIAIFWQMAI